MNVSRKPKCKLCLLSVIAFIMIALAGIEVALKIIDKVISGYGLEYYRTFEGFEFNYIGALIAIILLALLLLIAPIIYWFDPINKEEKDFKRKYEIKDH